MGASVGALGWPLGARKALLGRLWRVLVDLGAISIDLGSNLVPPRRILEPQRVDFDASEG